MYYPDNKTPVTIYVTNQKRGYQMRVLLITGVESAIQGWGKMVTTKKIMDSLQKRGHQCRILHARSNNEVIEHVASSQYDLAWSSVYYFNMNPKRVQNLYQIKSVTEVLEEVRVPFVGSPCKSNKIMIDKYRTIQMLKRNGIPTHEQYLLYALEDLEGIGFEGSFDPYIVKPNFESDSKGILEKNVFTQLSMAQARVKWMFRRKYSPILIEEYLPGDEYTVSVIGNGGNAKIYPVQNCVKEGAYKNYPVISSKTNKKGGISYTIPENMEADLAELARSVVAILGCRDYARLDIRASKCGELRVLGVNGVPDLDPAGSKSLIIHGLHNQQIIKPQHLFDLLVNDIVDAAVDRVYAHDSVGAADDSVYAYGAANAAEDSIYAYDAV